MKDQQRYLVTFELAFVYAVILSAIIFTIVDNQFTNSKTSEGTDSFHDELSNPDMSSSIPFEPMDICLCDMGLKIAHMERLNACGCQDGKGEKCTCDSCDCTSCVR